MQNEEVSHFLRNHSLGAGHFGGKRGSGFGFVTVFIRQKTKIRKNAGTNSIIFTNKI